MSGVKFDGQKPDMSLLSPFALEEIAKVMSAGKIKYGADNWRAGIAFSRLYSAVMRHLTAYNRGETKDPETGLSHLAHACCGLFMMIEFEATKPTLNDLYHCNKNPHEIMQDEIDRLMAQVKAGMDKLSVPKILVNNIEGNIIKFGEPNTDSTFIYSNGNDSTQTGEKSEQLEFIFEHGDDHDAK